MEIHVTPAGHILNVESFRSGNDIEARCRYRLTQEIALVLCQCRAGDGIDRARLPRCAARRTICVTFGLSNSSASPCMQRPQRHRLTLRFPLLLALPHSPRHERDRNETRAQTYASAVRKPLPNRVPRPGEFATDLALAPGLQLAEHPPVEHDVQHLDCQRRQNNERRHGCGCRRRARLVHVDYRD
jgi:hypothetical protein